MFEDVELDEKPLEKPVGEPEKKKWSFFSRKEEKPQAEKNYQKGDYKFRGHAYEAIRATLDEFAQTKMDFEDQLFEETGLSKGQIKETDVFQDIDTDKILPPNGDDPKKYYRNEENLDKFARNVFGIYELIGSGFNRNMESLRSLAYAQNPSKEKKDLLEKQDKYIAAAQKLTDQIKPIYQYAYEIMSNYASINNLKEEIYQAAEKKTKELEEQTKANKEIIEAKRNEAVNKVKENKTKELDENIEKLKAETEALREQRRNRTAEAEHLQKAKGVLEMGKTALQARMKQEELFELSKELHTLEENHAKAADKKKRELNELQKQKQYAVEHPEEAIPEIVKKHGEKKQKLEKAQQEVQRIRDTMSPLWKKADTLAEKQAAMEFAKTNLDNKLKLAYAKRIQVHLPVLRDMDKQQKSLTDRLMESKKALNRKDSPEFQRVKDEIELLHTSCKNLGRDNTKKIMSSAEWLEKTRNLRKALDDYIKTRDRNITSPEAGKDKKKFTDKGQQRLDLAKLLRQNLNARTLQLRGYEEELTIIKDNIQQEPEKKPVSEKLKPTINALKQPKLNKLEQQAKKAQNKVNELQDQKQNEAPEKVQPKKESENRPNIGEAEPVRKRSSSVVRKKSDDGMAMGGPK